MLDRRTRNIYFGGNSIEVALNLSASQLIALNEAASSGELEEDRRQYLREQEELRRRKATEKFLRRVF